jgi:hypothetical protein
MVRAYAARWKRRHPVLADIENSYGVVQEMRVVRSDGGRDAVAAGAALPSADATPSLEELVTRLLKVLL